VAKHEIRVLSVPGMSERGGGLRVEGLGISSRSSTRARAVEGLGIRAEDLGIRVEPQKPKA